MGEKETMSTHIKVLIVLSKLVSQMIIDVVSHRLTPLIAGVLLHILVIGQMLKP